jgi:hypothetical protein
VMLAAKTRLATDLEVMLAAKTCLYSRARNQHLHCLQLPQIWKGVT